MEIQRVELYLIHFTGSAELNNQGFIIGVDPGTVRLLGTATDGFGAADSIELNILNNFIQLQKNGL